MRINTDGVLLAVMADAARDDGILDVGTGTGVIALMLAQRFPEAQVFGVEIDESSADTARKNAEASPFSDRVEVHHTAFQRFKPKKPLDLIVSNPPFYVDALHNPDARKQQARHADRVFFDELLHYADQNLTKCGAIELILPPSLAEEVEQRAALLGFQLIRKISIHSFEDSPSIRSIVRFSKIVTGKAKLYDFIIYQSKGVYSEAYRKLLQPFFLAY